MKTSNILIALIILFSVSCTSKNSVNEHGHEHDEEGNHIEQEEFSIAGESTKEESTTANGEQASESSTRDQQNEITVLVPANEGVEYKFYLTQYEKLTYEWFSEAPLYFDFHAEPLDYEESKYFESFTEATADKMKGTMTIPFEGSHGWYWKNNSEKDVVVTLKTQGNYRIIGLKK